MREHVAMNNWCGPARPAVINHSWCIQVIRSSVNLIHFLDTAVDKTRKIIDFETVNLRRWQREWFYWIIPVFSISFCLSIILVCVGRITLTLHLTYWTITDCLMCPHLQSTCQSNKNIYFQSDTARITTNHRHYDVIRSQSNSSSGGWHHC